MSESKERYRLEIGLGNYLLDNEEAGKDKTIAYDCDEIACAELVRRANAYKKWIPVNERLPEKDDQYWTHWEIYDGDKLYARGEGQTFFDGDEWLTTSNVTHWQPLPAPPKGFEGRGISNS